MRSLKLIDRQQACFTIHAEGLYFFMRIDFMTFRTFEVSEKRIFHCSKRKGCNVAVITSFSWYVTWRFRLSVFPGLPSRGFVQDIALSLRFSLPHRVPALQMQGHRSLQV